VNQILPTRVTAVLDVFETLVPAKDRITIPVKSSRGFSHYADLAKRVPREPLFASNTRFFKLAVNIF
jgi:hypothetical protein